MEKIPPKPRPPVDLVSRNLRVIKEPSSPDPIVVVTVCVHQPTVDLYRCLASIAEQDLTDVGLLLLLDHPDYPAYDPTIPRSLRDRSWVLQANCGGAARARNTALEFVEQKIPRARWVARLDFDDRFSSASSLRAAFDLGESSGARFVLGGNSVLDADGNFLRANEATPWLLDPSAVLARLKEMADGEAFNELPSCNLLIRNGSGARYPDTRSAEDHWLVADLLVNRAAEVALLCNPLFADYTVCGSTTRNAKAQQKYLEARGALFAAADTWLRVRQIGERKLGLGQEGIVTLEAGVVTKRFYRGILTSDKVSWLQQHLTSGQDVVPVPQFEEDSDTGEWIARYPWEETLPFDKPSLEAVIGFLARCLEHGLVCGNIKRSNFRIRGDGSLLYIDIGNWIVGMDVSIFRDCAARLYSIGVLGASDEELLRRPIPPKSMPVWDSLPGFSSFYGQIISSLIQSRWGVQEDRSALSSPLRQHDATLLIKCCAMDSSILNGQVRRIVARLSTPRAFAEVVLAVDTYVGPYLRQYAEADLQSLQLTAMNLVRNGIVDRVVYCPSDSETARSVNLQWFGVESGETHSTQGIPVAPQLWGFEQVSTRFVLQCDVDVLIGRREHSHDFLGEMLEACQADDVVCVAFNIPHDPESGRLAYSAPLGEYKPEVRCGLLDLEKLRALAPLPNQLNDGRLREPWYRALHQKQRSLGFRTPRGGDPRTFYLHPTNPLKSQMRLFSRVADLVDQALVPPSHWEKWDVGPEAETWRYPLRSESVVIVARGRNTPTSKIRRFAAGLAMQDDQGFGVVVIDDASTDHSPEYLKSCLGFLGEKLTLVRHGIPMGRAQNSVLAIRELCSNPDAAIVVVDLDDALADYGVVRKVRRLFTAGHDVVLAAPFRPDAPCKIYEPNFLTPRQTYGGDVWIHLRSFAKRLFDQLPDEALQLDGEWLAYCEDVATMVPIVELASNPVYIPEYWYFHERTTGHSPEEQAQRAEVMLRILAKQHCAGGGH